MAQGAVRGLTAAERALLPPPFAAAVDFDRVRIVARYHSPLARLFGVTIVRGFRVFWAGAPIEARSLHERAHLAHELLHVWQYTALRRTGIELLASRRYRYRLDSARTFVSYGYEQQASIVEDHLRLKEGAAPRRATAPVDLSAYDRIIASAPDLAPPVRLREGGGRFPA